MPDKTELVDKLEKPWKGSTEQKPNPPSTKVEPPKKPQLLEKEASEADLDRMMQKEGV